MPSSWQARLKDAWQNAIGRRQGGRSAAGLHTDPGMGSARAPRTRRAPSRFTRSRRAWAATWPRRPSRPPNLTDGELLEAVRNGAAWSRSVFGEVAVPFGRYFRVGRRGGDRSGRSAGGSLQDVGMATPRAISFAPSRDGKQMIGHTGQSSTQVVIMTDPPESYAIIPLGESDHKESGHWDDQAEKLFSKGKALQTYFLRPDELMKHVTSKKVLVRSGR